MRQGVPSATSWQRDHASLHYILAWLNLWPELGADQNSVR
jgi:hypothetical protein